MVQSRRSTNTVDIALGGLDGGQILLVLPQERQVKQKQVNNHLLASKGVEEKASGMTVVGPQKGP